jgi:hypothetical protein
MSHLTPGQAELLVEVYRHPERGPAEHSRATGKDPGWINKLTRGLEALGLAERWAPQRRAAGSRTLRPIRPLHKALLVRPGRVVVFADRQAASVSWKARGEGAPHAAVADMGYRLRFAVDERWTAKLLADAPLLLGQPVLVLYRDSLRVPPKPTAKEELLFCFDLLHPPPEIPLTAPGSPMATLPPNEKQLCADWERVLPTLGDDEA